MKSWVKRWWSVCALMAPMSFTVAGMVIYAMIEIYCREPLMFFFVAWCVFAGVCFWFALKDIERIFFNLYMPARSEK